MNQSPWDELVEACTAVLRGVARRSGTITYSELRAELAPLEVADTGERDLAALLREVSVRADEAGEGLLSAVVVNRTGRPGRGWFRLAGERGRDVSEADRAWRAELERVYAAVSER